MDDIDRKIIAKLQIDGRMSRRARIELDHLDAANHSGKATSDAVTSSRPALPEGPAFSREVLLAAPDRLAAAQEVFARTGGFNRRI